MAIFLLQALTYCALTPRRAKGNGRLNSVEEQKSFSDAVVFWEARFMWLRAQDPKVNVE